MKSEDWSQTKFLWSTGALQVFLVSLYWLLVRYDTGAQPHLAQAQADQGPSYAYGALGSRFQLDSVVVDTVDTYAANFPAPKKTQYD